MNRNDCPLSVSQTMMLMMMMMMMMMELSIFQTKDLDPSWTGGLEDWELDVYFM